MNVNLYISLQPRAEADPPRDYFVIPGTEVKIDAASDALSGTATFDGLGSPPEPPGEVPGLEAISGTITWTCE